MSSNTDEAELTKIGTIDEKSAENYSSIDQLDSRINKELVIINGRINDMDRSALMKNLQNLNLNIYGNDTALKKRLKAHYRMKKLPLSELKSSDALYPYYVVVDFEATCNEENPPDFRHEIIEFPAVLVDSNKRDVIDEFHAYVKPKVNGQLTKFCSELTGISQETVDNASDFTVVLKNFETWLNKHKLGTKHKYALVTDGPWDMSRFMFLQCEISDIVFPYYAKSWVNLRKTYTRFYKTGKMRLSSMLEELGMKFQGRLHSGLDDSRNIAALLIAMINDGVMIKINESLRDFLWRYNYSNKNSKVPDISL